MGHKWRNFFLEGDFSYFRNDFKSLSGVNLDFSGEAEGYGVMFNLGASFDLSSSASVFFGFSVRVLSVRNLNSSF